MKCKKCGLELEKYSQYCNSCGTKVNVKRKKMIFSIFIILTMVVIAISLKMFAFVEKYDTPLKEITKLLNKQETDMDKIAKVIMPNVFVDVYKDVINLLESSDEYNDEIKELFEELPDSLKKVYETMFEEKYGENVKFSYDITDEEKLTNDEMESISEAYQELAKLSSSVKSIVKALDTCTDLDDEEIDELVEIVEDLENTLEEYNISEGYRLEVNARVEGKNDSDNNDYTIIVTKVDGHWNIDLLATYIVLENAISLDSIADYMKMSWLTEQKEGMKLMAEEMAGMEEDFIEILILDGIENIEKDLDSKNLANDKEAIVQLFKAVECSSSEFDIDTSKNIIVETNGSVISLKNNMQVYCIKDWLVEDFVNEIIEYLGTEEIELQSICFRDGVHIEIGFNEYGHANMEITAKGSEDYGNFSINK